MKITYTPNPLATKVELDDFEKEMFKLKLKIKEMEDDMFSAHFRLQEGTKHFDLDEARRELDPTYFLAEPNEGINQRVNMLFDCFIGDLAGSHLGDCTCFPMSCDKCIAEDILGIDTLKGLGKHEAYKISAAFDYKDGDEWRSRTLPEVLEILRTYAPKPTWEGSAEYIPRWTEEAKRAHEWLSNYATTHFKE